MDQDLFLEAAWSLDQDGTPVGPVDGTRGLLIRREVIEQLELLEVGFHGER